MSLDNHLVPNHRASNMSSVVIEFEGFQLKPHIFVIKELAYFDVDRDYHGRWSFLPPHPWKQLSPKDKKKFSWVTRYCHGLRWECGDLPYTALPLILSFLFVSYSDIYVKGLEKSKFLENLSGKKILDLNDFKCPKVGSLKHSTLICNDHIHDFKHCALSKAAAYGSFIKEGVISNRCHLSSECQP